MQTTQIQLFNPDELSRRFSSIQEFRKQLGEDRYFQIKGVSRNFSRRLLHRIDDLQELIPTVTLKHQGSDYNTSFGLLKRVSYHFKRLSDSQKGVSTTQTLEIDAKISSIGLQRIIDFAQGRRLRLNKLYPAEFNELISTADRLEVKEILAKASEVILKHAQTLSLADLVSYSKDICKLSIHFKPVLGKLFSDHLQHLLLRGAQYEYNREEAGLLAGLIAYLSESRFDLQLNLQGWKPSSKMVDQIYPLSVQELDLRDSDISIDLTKFDHLKIFRGSVANFTDFARLTHLESLDLDRMPSTLPARLHEFHLRHGTPIMQQINGLEKLQKFLFDHYVDIGQLSSYPRSRTLKIQPSRGSSVDAAAIDKIERRRPKYLYLKDFSLSPMTDDPPPLKHLREASLTECDSDTASWIVSSSRKLRTLHWRQDRILGERILQSIPNTLRQLTLGSSDSTPAVLQYLSHLTNLTSLSLHDFKWSQGGVQVLAGMTGLKSLSIVVNGEFLPGDITCLTNLKSLSSLSVKTGGSWPSTEGELKTLSKLPLTHLEITPDEKLAENGNLSQLSKMELQVLSLFGTNKLRDLSFIASSKCIEHLNLGGCRWVEESSLKHLEGLPKLRVLLVSVALSPEYKAKFFRCTPSLEQLVIQ